MSLFATSDLARRVAERNWEVGSLTFSHPKAANSRPLPNLEHNTIASSCVRKAEKKRGVTGHAQSHSHFGRLWRNVEQTLSSMTNVVDT